MLTLGLSGFSSEVHCEHEIKTVSNFLHFLSSPTVMSQVLFLKIISDNFTDHSAIMIDENNHVNIPISLKCFIQFV